MFSIPTKRFKYVFYVCITNMEKELLENIKTFLKSAELVYRAGDFTSATILYFKTLFAAMDLAIFKKKRLTPKDHSERFRILEKDFPTEYKLLDKYYDTYRSTYSTKTDKDTCEEIRKHVRKIVKENFGI